MAWPLPSVAFPGADTAGINAFNHRLQTAYTVTIDSTGTPYYSGACTAALCPGTAIVSAGEIVWAFGTIGNITINQVVAQTSPSETIPDDLDVAANLSTGASAATITISYSATGFSIGDSPATINVVQGQAGTYTTTSYTGYVDTTNKLFGTKLQVGTTSVGGILAGLPGPNTNPFSMTVSETLTLPASVGVNGTASFNNDLSLMVANYAPLSLKCGASTGKVGSPYNSSLLANGGVAPYTFSIIGGSIAIVAQQCYGRAQRDPHGRRSAVLHGSGGGLLRHYRRECDHGRLHHHHTDCKNSAASSHVPDKYGNRWQSVQLAGRSHRRDAALHVLPVFWQSAQRIVFEYLNRGHQRHADTGIRHGRIQDKSDRFAG